MYNARAGREEPCLTPCVFDARPDCAEPCWKAVEDVRAMSNARASCAEPCESHVQAVKRPC